MPVFTQLAAQASYLLVALIFLLVPTARLIEAQLRTLVAEVPVLCGGAMLLAGAAVVVSYLRYLRRHLTTREQLRPHLTRILGLLLCSLLLVRLPVEYGHIILYAALGFAARLAAPRPPSSQILLRVALVGLADELLQGAWPQRVFDIHDLVLNIFSAATGVSAAFTERR